MESKRRERDLNCIAWDEHEHLGEVGWVVGRHQISQHHYHHHNHTQREVCSGGRWSKVMIWWLFYWALVVVVVIIGRMTVIWFFWSRKRHGRIEKEPRNKETWNIYRVLAKFNLTRIVKGIMNKWGIILKWNVNIKF